MVEGGEMRWVKRFCEIYTIIRERVFVLLISHDVMVFLGGVPIIDWLVIGGLD